MVQVGAWRAWALPGGPLVRHHGSQGHVPDAAKRLRNHGRLRQARVNPFMEAEPSPTEIVQLDDLLRQVTPRDVVA